MSRKTKHVTEQGLSVRVEHEWPKARTSAYNTTEEGNGIFQRIARTQKHCWQVWNSQPHASAKQETIIDARELALVGGET